MDINQPDMHSLFEQLGLPSHSEAIEDFISQHKLTAKTHLVNADFWSSSQKHFLKEALEEDASWTEVIDQLDARLRH
ncbi:DUF2789 domain-containing protein [Shewanella sp. AS1]|uniref:DUF2789 domain-containing protein n=1 Tax=Shewanella sp. AS1 TaxID=2907626 RepID=UPI001F2FC1A9|nr:DUF2789 domain-containing protein [Shewanella sp. AS1]MCE9678147.1 DUF2789 domain-containing protein [Shewanella sp. AS1]